MRRRILVVTASIAVAVGAIAPVANAAYIQQKAEPPDCGTLIGNVVGGDIACEDSEFTP